MDKDMLLKRIAEQDIINSKVIDKNNEDFMKRMIDQEREMNRTIIYNDLQRMNYQEQEIKRMANISKNRFDIFDTDVNIENVMRNMARYDRELMRKQNLHGAGDIIQ